MTPDDDTPPMQDRPAKRRRGPPPIPLAEKRRHRVSVYLNDAELAALIAQVFPGEEVDAQAQGLRQALGRHMRDATFDRLPPQIPAINREAWTELSRLAGNLNRYVVAIDQGHAQGMPPALAAELRDQVQTLRRELLGLRDQDEPATEEGDQ